MAEDEEYKRVIYEKIPSLNPSFKKNGGTITPANSSSLNDGASALILMSAEKAKELGLKPLAKVVCEYNRSLFVCLFVSRSLNFVLQPTLMPASSPSTSLRHLHTLSRPPSRGQVSNSTTSLNLRSTRHSLLSSGSPRRSSVLTRRRSTSTGTYLVLSTSPNSHHSLASGAVALGHAVGNSGSRIVVSLIHSLKSGEYGAAGICNGVSILPCNLLQQSILTVMSAGWCCVCFGYPEVVNYSYTLYCYHLAIITRIRTPCAIAGFLDNAERVSFQPSRTDPPFRDRNLSVCAFCTEHLVFMRVAAQKRLPATPVRQLPSSP